VPPNTDQPVHLPRKFGWCDILSSRMRSDCKNILRLKMIFQRNYQHAGLIDNARRRLKFVILLATQRNNEDCVDMFLRDVTTRMVWILAVLALPISLQPGQAQNLGAIIDVSQAATKEGEASQARVDSLDDETDALTREYGAALKQLASLRAYNDQLEKLISAQNDEAVSIRLQIEDVTNVDRTIGPLMFRMIDALDQFVELDVPFLIDQRRARVQNLRAMMDRSDINPAEKYRNILEAYEIENEYGRTIEAYERGLEIDGEERLVAFLRIGRVALIYQTLDGAESGTWDKTSKSFVDLDGAFDREVRAALRIAKQQAAPDLLVIPVLSGE
jgi:tetratricopeptide (TPR) repeat protein